MALPNLPALKKNLPLVIAGISALLAVFFINMYIKQQGEEARQKVEQSQKNIATIVVAAGDIPRGTKITDQMIREERVPKQKVKPNTATSAAKVLYKYALVSLKKGEAIPLDKLGVPEEKRLPDILSSRIPPGKRAVTIPVDDISAVGGMIQPGDAVDVMGLVSIPGPEGKQGENITTLPLFQNIQVLAVGNELNPGRPSEKPRSNITLALAPQEANIITFMQEYGKIRLVLRSPGDKQSAHSVPTDWDTVLSTILPQQHRPEQAPSLKPRRTIEIYHGAKKELKSVE
ncbi:MAG: Flp pilus assembly protein CpaB [Candidatus Omnitrophica bacterium]|nr:Flp pilus assembly protein CpaB [Candidatus Omnitrophota bacterium]